MALMRHRDVSGATFNGQSLTPCTEATLGIASTTVEGTGDEAQSLRYIGVTGIEGAMSMTTYNITVSAHVGDDGGASYIAPSTTGATTGTMVTAAHAVCTSVDVSIEHQGLATKTVNLGTYSTAGRTTSITLATSQSITATTAKETDFYRDIYSVSFEGTAATTTFTGVRSVGWTETGSEITDSADVDDHITYRGMTDRAVDMSVVVRDMGLAYSQTGVSSGSINIGAKGTITVKVSQCQPSSGRVITATGGATFTLANAVRIAADGSSPHGDMNEFTLTFKAHGEDGAEAEVTYTAGL